MQSLIFQSFLISVLSLFLFAQCAKSDSSAANSNSNEPSTSSLKSTPTANAAYDNSAQGIYTGTITGSTGSWTINYDNNGSGAAPVFDYYYTPTGGSKVSGSITGSKNIVGNTHTLSFSGTVSGSAFVVSLAVDNTSGAITSATLTVGGNAISILAYKEKSTALVTAYEGTSSGSMVSAVYGVTAALTGVFNTTATPGTFQGAARILTVAGVACSGAGCSSTLNSIALGVGNIASGSTVPASCGWTPVTGTCNCQTNFTSNQGVTASTTSISGTWNSTIAATSSSCTGQTGTAMANGFTYASGTWTATRTR